MPLKCSHIQFIHKIYPISHIIQSKYFFYHFRTFPADTG